MIAATTEMENQGHAVKQLYASHHDALERFAMKLTGNGAAADDLVQDTWLRVVRFLNRYTPGTNFRACAVRIMKHIHIDHYRANVRRRVTMDSALPGTELVDDRARCPEEVLQAETFGPERLLESIRSLPEDYRSLLTLIDVHGATYAEAARNLRCPIGTVMSRLSRGRHLLRNRLYSEYPEYA